jgi:D-serine deaminase-like pyridoxal phosphate-dependent protein
MLFTRRIVVALLLAVVAVGPAQAVERILRFVSDAEVQRNGDLAVTETIRVQAEGNQIRHGIFRDFPTTYARPDGSRVVVGFDVQSVTRDGTADNWTTEALANGVRVRIGRAEVTLPNGEHEYVIRYRTTRQIGFFADYDELYWNATGNG